MPAGFGFRAPVDELYAAEGIVPRVSFESEDLTTAEGLAGAGALRLVWLTWRTDRDPAPPAAHFLDFVRTVRNPDPVSVP